jgi:hypothetical protein
MNAQPTVQELLDSIQDEDTVATVPVEDEDENDPALDEVETPDPVLETITEALDDPDAPYRAKIDALTDAVGYALEVDRLIAQRDDLFAKVQENPGDERAVEAWNRAAYQADLAQDEVQFYGVPDAQLEDELTKSGLALEELLIEQGTLRTAGNRPLKLAAVEQAISQLDLLRLQSEKELQRRAGKVEVERFITAAASAQAEAELRVAQAKALEDAEYRGASPVQLDNLKAEFDAPVEESEEWTRLLGQETAKLRKELGDRALRSFIQRGGGWSGRRIISTPSENGEAAAAPSTRTGGRAYR